jgi:hypothetical protein
MAAGPGATYGIFDGRRRAAQAFAVGADSGVVTTTALLEAGTTYSLTITAAINGQTASAKIEIAVAAIPQTVGFDSAISNAEADDTNNAGADASSSMGAAIGGAVAGVALVVLFVVLLVTRRSKEPKEDALQFENTLYSTNPNYRDSTLKGTTYLEPSNTISQVKYSNGNMYGNVDAGETLYDFGSEPTATEHEAIYDLGEEATEQEAIYDLGEEATEQEAIYDLGEEATQQEAIYDFGVEATGQEAIYDFGTEAPAEEEAIYDLGDNKRGGYLAISVDMTVEEKK